MTRVRLIDLSGGGAGVALSSRFVMPGVAATTLAQGDTLWLGLNAGEWGGGLHRIERRTGHVTAIEDAGAPVNGLTVMPGKPECLLVAMGLVHFFPSGELVEVCGTRTTPFLEVPYTLEPGGRTVEPGLGTVPFYGLATVGEGTVWAIGRNGLYRIGADRVPRFQPLPPMRRVAGVTSSLDVPGLALVYSSINGRVSISGAAPMIVAR